MVVVAQLIFAVLFYAGTSFMIPFAARYGYFKRKLTNGECTVIILINLAVNWALFTQTMSMHGIPLLIYLFMGISIFLMKK